MKEQLTTVQKQNKKQKNYDTHPLPLHLNSNMNKPPPTFPSPHHLK